MFIIYFFRFLMGYLTVSFSGEFAERLINICAKNKITLWNIKRSGNKIFANISVKSFKKLRILRRKCKVKVNIVKRHGFVFFLNSYKLRFGAVAGIVVYFCVILYLSGFIWSIDIVCKENTDNSQILSKLQDLGIKEGIRKKNIDTKNQRLELIMSVDDLSWAALNIEGSKLTVDITLSDKIVKKDTMPCNLVAAKDGVIKSIRVSMGQTVVSTEQTVLKGDLLVSGVIEDKMGKTSFKHSDGEIIAVTTQKITKSISFNRFEQITTGKKIRKNVLNFFGIKIPLYLGSVKFDYIKSKSKYELSLLGVKLPISVVVAEFNEVKQTSYVIDRDRAIALADIEFKAQMESSKYISYNIDDVIISENADSISVTYCVTGQENIATKEFLSINTTN